MAMSQGHDSLSAFDSYQLLVARVPPLSDNDRICIICLSEMRHGEVLRYTPCMHLFHYDCIFSHVMSSTIGADWVEAGLGHGSPDWARCPTCRTPLAFLEVTTHPGDAGAILDIRGKCAPPAPVARAKKPPPPLPPSTRNLERVQAAMQDILDHTSNVRDITEAVAAARAQAAGAASQAAAAAYAAYQLQRASSAAAAVASSGTGASASDLPRPPQRAKPRPPPLPSDEIAWKPPPANPTTVSAMVVGWEAKSKGPPSSASGGISAQVPPPKHPPLGGAAPARVVIRVRELPPAVFDQAVRFLHTPDLDGRAWQHLGNPHTAAFAQGSPPTWGTFSGDVVLIFHGDVWYMRSGTEVTEEIRAAITYADGEIEFID